MKRTATFVILLFLAASLSGQGSFTETKQQLDSIVLSAWYEVTSQWSASVVLKYQYDENERLIQSNQHYYNVDWRIKHEFVYDTNAYLIRETEYSWDNETEEWVNVEKFENTYNEDGQLIERSMYDWNESLSIWEVDTKSLYAYNFQDILTEMTEYEWSSISSIYIEDWKEGYSYDANNNLIRQLDYKWEWLSGTFKWDTVWEHSYVYNTGNQLIEEYDHQREEGQWSPNMKQLYNYDDIGNLELGTTFDWDAGGSQWVNVEKYEYQYDNNFTPSDLIIPFNLEETGLLFKHMLLSYYGYTWVDTSAVWKNYFMAELYYTEAGPGLVSDHEINSVELFPNPVSDILYFETSTHSGELNFVLYDGQGRLVVSEQLNSSSISLHHLKRGIYFYRLCDNESIDQKGRILKE